MQQQITRINIFIKCYESEIIERQNISRKHIVPLLCYSVGQRSYKPAKIQEKRIQTPLLKERRLEEFGSH